MSSLPTSWHRRRLRFDARLNPVKSELMVSGDTEVSFVPMDAVGEHGGLRLDEQRLLDDVYTGFTYFRDGDVVVAKITPCFENGKTALAFGLVNGVGFGTTELHVLRAGNTLDARFLFYLTIAHDFRSYGEAEMLGAGGQKRVPERFFKEWRAPLPTIDAQERIAALLDEKTAQLDALIEKKQQLLERLSEKRQAIITQAVTMGLDPSAPMKDSGIDWLGQIPAHWDVKRLRFSITKIEQGWSPQCETREAELDEWGVLKVGCVNGHEYNERENKALPQAVEPERQYEVRVGDVLISRANTKELLGSAAVVHATKGRVLLCDKLYRIKLTENLDPVFLLGFLRSPLARLQYERDSSGTSGSMQNIRQETISNLLHPLPPLDEQIAIARSFRAQALKSDVIMRTIQQTIERLTEYRSAIITAAVTGQIEELH